MANKFQFYEVVKVTTKDKELAEINGQTGAVLGMVENDGEWIYAIHQLDADEGWDVFETDLEATGKFMTREDFYDGSSVQVTVDPVTCEGKISG